MCRMHRIAGHYDVRQIKVTNNDQAIAQLSQTSKVKMSNQSMYNIMLQQAVPAYSFLLRLRPK